MIDNWKNIFPKIIEKRGKHIVFTLGLLPVSLFQGGGGYNVLAARLFLLAPEDITVP